MAKAKGRERNKEENGVNTAEGTIKSNQT